VPSAQPGGRFIAVVLGEHEDVGRSRTLVLVVDAFAVVLCRRDRRAGLLQQLHRLLVHAQHRTGRIVQFAVDVQHLFHACHEFGVGLGRESAVPGGDGAEAMVDGGDATERGPLAQAGGEGVDQLDAVRGVVGVRDVDGLTGGVSGIYSRRNDREVEVRALGRGGDAAE